MQIERITGAAFAIVLTMQAFGCTRTEPAPSGSASTTSAQVDKTSISVKGSDTMVILGQRWAEDYMKKNPGKKVQVTGGGSGTGIAALVNGTTDVADASRAIKEAETAKIRERFNVLPEETVVARDGVALYVNANTADP